MVHKDRPPSSICIEIWTRSTPGESAPDYEVCASPDAKGTGWKGSIARKRENGPQLRIGADQGRAAERHAHRDAHRPRPDQAPGVLPLARRDDELRERLQGGGGLPGLRAGSPGTAETALGKPRS